LARSATWTERGTALMHRLHALGATRRPVPARLLGDPEPRSMGHFARGRQLVAGTFLLGGQLIEAPRQSVWDIGDKDDPYAIALHGCAWLDDLAAVGDAAARSRAQAWVGDWIDRYGRGTGPGWTPELAGRRLIRWISHSALLLRGAEEEASQRFLQSLSAQCAFLAHRWRTAPEGLARFEALTGMIHAGLALEGMEGHVPPALEALARDCATGITAEGGIPTRNPETLLEVFTLLTWSMQALTEVDRIPPPALVEALGRIAPTLRALRHADGGLARFHGGGRGLEGRLDHALAAAGVRGFARGGLHMGFARLAAGRTTVIVDAAAPPTGERSVDAHASTLALELTSGRRPVVVNCGSGASFGAEWRRAGRATPSHSTLVIEGYSSSRLARPDRSARFAQEWLVDVPGRVICEQTPLSGGLRMELAHDGWIRTHGLTHARILELSADGRALAAEDLLTTLDPSDEAAFDRVMAHSGRLGVAFTIRFHLHPEVEAAPDPEGRYIALGLRSGERWILSHDGACRLSLESSVYLETGRLRPRPAQQVVLSGRAMAYATRVRWSLAKAQETPNALRDLAPAGELPDETME
jgi:uncharacterized heparinase superfamily protein